MRGVVTAVGIRAAIAGAETVVGGPSRTLSRFIRVGFALSLSLRMPRKNVARGPRGFAGLSERAEDEGKTGQIGCEKFGLQRPAKTLRENAKNSDWGQGFGSSRHER